MSRMFDNIILLILSLIILFSGNNFIAPVIIFLLLFCMSAMGLYLRDTKIIKYILLIYILISAFVPQCIVYIPIILYIAFMNNIKWEAAAGVIAFLMCILTKDYEMWQLVYVLVVMALSVYIQYKSSKIEILSNELIRLRDTSAEYNMMLKGKNKTLLEKQDYEIYLATLRERNRIAREIHDNVGHMLSRSILQIGALLSINKDETMQEHLVNVKDTLNQAMNSIRESVHDLHNESVDMKKAIYDAIEDMKDYKINIDYDVSPAVPRAIKYCFIATVKEAMNNIVKHSNGDSVNIILREHPGFYQLLIEDNGKVSNRSLKGGIGLENMRERVEAFSGTFRIDTEKGFKIFISINKSNVNSDT